MARLDLGAIGVSDESDREYGLAGRLLRGRFLSQSTCPRSSLPADKADSLSMQTEVVAHVSCGRLIAALDSAQKSGAAVSVLHLLCHGGEVGSTFGLSLDSDEVGAAGVVVDAGRLLELLAPYASTLRLVVLCACESGNPGSLGISSGVSLRLCIGRELPV